MLSNSQLAELLSREGDRAEGIRRRAFRRAARSAFLWPEDAASLLQQDRSLEELHSVGPFIGKQLREWIEDPPRGLEDVPAIRCDFLATADARRLLEATPDWRAKLRGDLQMHTDWSDGSGTVAEMAAAATERKYEYIAVTDHTKALSIAGGIDEAQLAQQSEEIGNVNRDGGATVLRSAELNLTMRGEADIDAKTLRKLDIVLGSFHSALRKKDDQTDRYLAAVRNPHLHILGHPRGRIYNYRIGLTAEWSRVFAEAAKLDKALEIDCYPDRQDLNVELLKIARHAGNRISLGTDAHHPWQLEFIELGLAAALTAKIPADRIINFMSLEKLKAWDASLRG
ncbi:MAG: PHP domain-containing protein [Chthoniobacterales bacterium]